ncbi:MAG TPA: EVE domain-containing protein [Myxococcaceae bacterium]|nr:EVE domain-containing protein [Myxococcaceae bacterium]
MPAHWLIKSEPSAYSFARLQSDGRTEWTGVRNFEARNNLRAMAVGDLCLYYHSTEEKAVVGIARISRAAQPDPTAPGEDWASVEVEPVEPLAAPVALERIRADGALKGFPLVTRGRLSVAPVTPADYVRVLALSREPQSAARRVPTKRAPAHRSPRRKRRAR